MKTALRILINNLLIPLLELLWGVLLYFGVFDPFIKGFNNHGQGMPIDLVFFFSSQAVIFVIWLWFVLFKMRAVASKRYYVGSSIGGLVTFFFFLWQFHASAQWFVLSLLAILVFIWGASNLVHSPGRKKRNV